MENRSRFSELNEDGKRAEGEECRVWNLRMDISYVITLLRQTDENFAVP